MAMPLRTIAAWTATVSPELREQRQQWMEPGCGAQDIEHLQALRLVQGRQGGKLFLETWRTHARLHGEDDTAWTAAQLDSSDLIHSLR